MIVLVTGGTMKSLEKLGLDITSVKQGARAALRPYAEIGNLLIAGGANGWDEMCRTAWHYDYQLPYVVVPAPWDRAGRAAGPARNHTMVVGNSIAPYAQLRPDICLAGPGDKGTRDTIERCHNAGIPVEKASFT